MDVPGKEDLLSPWCWRYLLIAGTSRSESETPHLPPPLLASGFQGTRSQGCVRQQSTFAIRCGSAFFPLVLHLVIHTEVSSSCN